MYSFRLDQNLINLAKKAASKMDISLSSFISYSIKEKLNSIGIGNNQDCYSIVNRNSTNNLKEIAEEIRKLRSDLRKIFEEQ